MTRTAALLGPAPGPVAQLAEQQTLNLLVEGSIPSGLTTFPSSLKAVRITRRPRLSLQSRRRGRCASPLRRHRAQARPVVSATSLSDRTAVTVVPSLAARLTLNRAVSIRR